MKKFVLGFVSAIIAIALPAAVYAFWMADVSAMVPPGPMDALLARISDRAVVRAAPSKANPFGKDPAAVKVGLDHYKANCVACHGGPGIEPAELASGLNPPAPDLAKEARGLTDGQIYWIVSNGIRMTGMPAFSPTHEEDERWKIVAFVRHLPDLTADEKKDLAGGLKSEEEHEHHHHDEAPGVGPPR